MNLSFSNIQRQKLTVHATFYPSQCEQSNKNRLNLFFFPYSIELNNDIYIYIYIYIYILREQTLAHTFTIIYYLIVFKDKVLYKTNICKENINSQVSTRYRKRHFEGVVVDGSGRNILSRTS
jgi:hypothetical protein